MKRPTIDPVSSRYEHTADSDDITPLTETTESLIAASIKTRAESQRLCLQARSIAERMHHVMDGLFLTRRAFDHNRGHRPTE